MRARPRLTPTRGRRHSSATTAARPRAPSFLFVLSRRAGGSRCAPCQCPPAAQLTTAREGRPQTMARRPHSHRRHPRQRGRRRGGERSVAARAARSFDGDPGAARPRLPRRVNGAGGPSRLPVRPGGEPRRARPKQATPPAAACPRDGHHKPALLPSHAGPPFRRHRRQLARPFPCQPAPPETPRRARARADTNSPPRAQATCSTTRAPGGGCGDGRQDGEGGV